MKTDDSDSSKPPSSFTEKFNQPIGHAFLIGFAGVFMAGLSWRGWPDALGDYGNQLYFPWQISTGKILYQDLFYIYGPLSQYVHGVLFKIFGVDIMVIAGFNILLIIAFTVLLYRMFTCLSDKATGMACALTFVTVFAFAQYTGIGNFNFVSAYRHELPHGAMLSIFTLFLFHQFQISRNLIYLAGSGLALGLTFLTKSEVFTALFIALVPLAILSLSSNNHVSSSRFILFTTFTGAFLFPTILFAIWFSLHSPFPQALDFLRLPWLLTLIPEVRQSPFYQLVMGTENIPGNALLMTQYALSLIMIFLTVVGINHASQKLKLPRIPASFALFFLTIGVCYWQFDWVRMLDAARALPLLIVVLLFLEGWRLKSLWDTKDRSRQLLQFMLTLFALLLLSKMMFFTRLGHYGFVLSLPATLLLVKAFLFDGRKWTLELSGIDWAYRSMSWALVISFILGHVYVSYFHYSKKTFILGNSEEYIYDYHPRILSRGLLVQTATDFIEGKLAKDDTLTAFPTSASFNYMTRRRNPIKYDNFTPTEQIIFGEQPMIDALKENSPDWILFTTHDYSSFGAKTFGTDYAVQVFAWIRQHYQPAETLGDNPFDQPKGFGIQFWKKKTTAIKEFPEKTVK